MKNGPVLVATVFGLLAVILSFINLRVGLERLQTNNAHQAAKNAERTAARAARNTRHAAKNAQQSELLKNQMLIQELNQTITLQNQEFSRQTEIINLGASIAQKIGPPILREMGYCAVKNSNEGLKTMLHKHNLESFLPTAGELRRLDETRTK